MDHYLSLPLESSGAFDLSVIAKDYAFTKGIAMKYEDLPEDTVTYAPFCLFPSPFPEKWFSFAKSMQCSVNVLMHRVANDYNFLRNSLKRTVESDDFTENVFHIYEAVQKEGIQQTYSLALLRTDYMLNVSSEGTIDGIKQVEINTIASSFGGLTTELTGLHKVALKHLKKKDCVPENAASTKLAFGLVKAWQLYENDNAAIMFLVEDIVYNIMDHKHLAQAINNHNKEIDVLFYTFQNIRQFGEFKDNRLFVKSQEIAVVYFRTGYSPDQYNVGDWELRLKIERSKAIKCPTANYHLAGTKKVQQELARPGMLENFLDEKNTVENIRKTFVELLSLDCNEEGDRAAEKALKDPQRYVMKPQREGGGNNIYGEDITKYLKRVGKSKERESYILMERIFPPPVDNYILRRGHPLAISKAVGELGIYGVLLSNGETIVENFEAGHLVRTKALGTNEGGIVAGFGALDCPYLI